MDIMVCFKVVPDLDLLSGSGWVIDNRFRVETGFVKNMLNPYDESSLEMALKVSDQARETGIRLRLSALTISDSKANLFLKTLNALKFDQTVRIEGTGDNRFSPELCATLISAYVKRTGMPDYLIMGRQSGVGDNAMTPLITAEILKWPCITGVLSIEPSKDSCLRVTCQADDGLYRQVVEPPCILTVGNAPNTYLRIPTLKDIKAHGQNPVEVLNADDLVADGRPVLLPDNCELQSLEAIGSDREGIIIAAGTASEKAHILYHSYLKGWLADL
jgi:electron transfer flavoprotein beta subunit